MAVGQVLISTIAFVVWVFAIGGPFASLDWYKPVYGGIALILVTGDEQHKLNVPRKSLPRGARDGHWLQVELEGDRLLNAAIDREEKDRAPQRIRDKMERLRRGEHLR